MGTNTEFTVSELNDLLEVCRNGEKGFLEAADGVKDMNLRATLTQYANERAQFATELEAVVREHGGKPEEGGTLAGALHRGWINIKSAITGKSDHAILEECERGEDIAKESYQKVLDSTNLPDTIQAMIQRQYTQIKLAHDRVRDLRDSTDVIV